MSVVVHYNYITLACGLKYITSKLIYQYTQKGSVGYEL